MLEKKFYQIFLVWFLRKVKLLGYFTGFSNIFYFPLLIDNIFPLECLYFYISFSL